MLGLEDSGMPEGRSRTVTSLQGNGHGRTRTFNRRFRRPVLYPIELHSLDPPEFPSGDAEYSRPVRLAENQGSANRKKGGDWEAAGSSTRGVGTGVLGEGPNHRNSASDV